MALEVDQLTVRSVLTCEVGFLQRLYITEPHFACTITFRPTAHAISNPLTGLVLELASQSPSANPSVCAITLGSAAAAASPAVRVGDILVRINKIPVELLVVDGTAVGAIRLAMVHEALGKQWASVCMKEGGAALTLTFERAEAKPAPLRKKKSAVSRLIAGIKNTFSPKSARKAKKQAAKDSEKASAVTTDSVNTKQGGASLDNIDLAAAKRMAREASTELSVVVDDGAAADGYGSRAVDGDCDWTGVAMSHRVGAGSVLAGTLSNTEQSPSASTNADLGYSLISDAKLDGGEYSTAKDRGEDKTDEEVVEVAEVAVSGGEHEDIDDAPRSNGANRAAEYEVPTMASKRAEFVVRLEPVDEEYGIAFGGGDNDTIVVSEIASYLKSPYPPQVGDEVLAVGSTQVFSLQAANLLLPSVGPKRTATLHITVARTFPVHTTAPTAATTTAPATHLPTVQTAAQEPEPTAEPARVPAFEVPIMTSKRAEFVVKLEATGTSPAGAPTFGIVFKQGAETTVLVSAVGRVKASYAPEKNDEVLAIDGVETTTIAGAMAQLAASNATRVNMKFARQFGVVAASPSPTASPSAAPKKIPSHDVLDEVASPVSEDETHFVDVSSTLPPASDVTLSPLSPTASGEYLVTYPAVGVDSESPAVFTNDDDGGEAATSVLQLSRTNNLPHGESSSDSPTKGNAVDVAQSKTVPLATRFPCFVSGLAKHSQHGTRHGNLNQDGAFCRKLFTPAGDVVVAVVFDGHGILGELSAEVAVRRMGLILDDPAEVDLLIANPEAWIVATFDALQASVEEAHKDPPQQYTYPGKPGSEPLEFKLHTVGGRFGIAYKCETVELPPAPIDFGCTAAMAVVIGDTLTTGCIGDAGCVLCYRDPEYDGNAGKVLSVAHTASEPTEIQRIERDFEGKAFLTPDGYLAPLDDELAQYEVQLTRSLGHCLLKEFGITCTPDVRQQSLSVDKSFALLLCSDGITDELQPRDIAERINDAANAAEACAVLCQDAQDFCMNRDKVDDCTAVVLKFSRPSGLSVRGESC
eukprot:gene9977-11716_t